MDGKTIDAVGLSYSCIQKIKELSGLNENEFTNNLKIRQCTRILNELEDTSKKQNMIEQLIESLKKSETSNRDERIVEKQQVEKQQVEKQQVEKQQVKKSKENISKLNETADKVPMPTEYRTLNITNNFNRVKRNQGLQNEDFKNVVFGAIKDKDREGLRNQTISIQSLIFDISENGSIRLFGTGKLDAATVIQNRKNRSKKDQISIKVIDFSSFVNNNDESVSIIPELKNLNLKKYFSNIVNHVDSIDMYQELIEIGEINPSKDIKLEAIPKKIGNGGSARQILSTENYSKKEYDPPLHFPTNMEEKIAEIQKSIIVDRDIIYQIVGELIAGKNILLVGPVGSGKTALSKKISEILWRDDEFSGFLSKPFTAHSEWTVADVIGGIAPKISNGESDKVEFMYKPGCVVQTVADNWIDGDSELKQRNFVNYNGKQYRGTWLLIDEFNRANIDKSFGEMFTAIEYSKLTISDNKNNKPTRELKIPQDYRIIGTLNSTDKHFLTELSNALKRRFAMIEISYPTYEEKYREMYHVIKSSVQGLGILEIEELLDHDKQKYVINNDDKIDRIIENVYSIIYFVRQMKPLGTSVLISILRGIFATDKLKNISTDNGSLESIFDDCLKSHLIPQFEDLKPKQLELLSYFFSKNKLSSYRNDFGTDELYVQHNEEFKNIIKFTAKIKGVNDNKIRKKMKNIPLDRKENERDDEFLKRQKDEDSAMRDTFDSYWKGVRPALPRVSARIGEMLKERGNLTSQENDEIEDIE